MKRLIKNINAKKIFTKTMEGIIILLVFTSFILYYLSRPVYTNRVIQIPKGNTNYIIKYLNHKGFDIYKIDKIIIDSFGYPQAGWVDLKSTKMSKLDFLYKITHSKAAIAKVMIIPGETNYFIFKQIEKRLKIPGFKCDIDEGFLKPDTYFLPIGMRPQRVCEYLYNIALSWHKGISYKFTGTWNYNLYRTKLIIASIIQKEAGNTDEMPLISAVIYNRLKKHMKLQMDGTLNYGRFSHTKVTPYMLRNDKSPYNTYKRYGLPKSPVCVVSREAIKAAFFPAKVNYLYFVKCKNTQLFSSTFREHLKNIRKCKGR